MTNKFQLFIHALLIAIIVVGSGCFHKQVAVQYSDKVSKNIQPALQDSIAVSNILFPYKVAMEAKMNAVIGFNDTVLAKDRPNGTLGNLVCDAILESANKNNTALASVMNYGGVRVPRLGQGDVTLGEVFEIMPFDNEICIVAMPGNIVDTLCQQIAQSGGWPVSHLSFVIKNKKATQISINNEPLDYSKTYPIAMSDYIANGGDKCSYLIPLPRINCNVMVRDALVDYIRQQKRPGGRLIQYPLERLQN